jgi:hypothetical protein
MQLEPKTFGEYGGVFVNNTTKTDAPYGGSFYAVQCVTDTVFSAMVDNISGAMTGITIPAGTTIYGLTSSFTLTSGSVIAYKNKP